MARDVLRELIVNRKKRNYIGISSFCTANEEVIEACLEQGKRFNDFVLIEATANQVNQFGGYTGLRPFDFRNLVHGIADRIDFPHENILLGGDHLGPLVWSDETESSAMKKAEDLVRLYVEAGFQKIHLDTSMHLASDDSQKPLSKEVVAMRGARLCKICEETWSALAKYDSFAYHPVYIIGSEVPVPGGVKDIKGAISITNPEDLEETMRCYCEEFHKQGLDEAFHNIIGVVVQLGVEFGDDEVHKFDCVAVSDLARQTNKQMDFVFEGHSTDYQSPASLKEMVKNGVAILKVGPALTFAFREALYALSMIEKELISVERQAHFIEKLEQVMLEQPLSWESYYHGNTEEQAIKRKYSYSDRSRYYLSQPIVKNAIKQLYENINGVHIPKGMLHQYMPIQYMKIRNGSLDMKAENLVKSAVMEVADDYNYAVKQNYYVGSVLY